MKKEFVCVACPIGCRLRVTLEDGRVALVEGNTCKKGDAYARAECTHPTRSLTTTVRVRGGRTPLVSVKSAAPIPKEKMMEAMETLREVVLEAPIEIGGVAVKNILGTGIDMVATNRCPLK